MNALHNYLNFDGNAREAMTFYAKCLDAKLDLQSFKDVKIPGPPESDDRIVHARLSKGSIVLMASDTMPGMPHVPGNNVWISVDCESVDEVGKLHASIGAGGRSVMEPQDTFWGARFAMVTDKYGIGWMFNHALPKKA